MIIITGANGVVGHPLVARLRAKDSKCKTVSRGANANIQWNLDHPLDDLTRSQLLGAESLVHCAPIWLLPRHVDALGQIGVSRMVVFSSTSVISKQASPSLAEQGLVTQLAEAEAALTASCEQAGIALTILRPSMIYGYGRDQNIMQIAKLIQKLSFVPLISSATGLRQPVHADDLVEAALAVIQRTDTEGKTYNLAGAETLSYRKMVERIFLALNAKVRILSLPLPIYRACLRLAAWCGFSFDAEMADRMRQDLNYDYAEATTDFGYRPQAFLQHPERDLKPNAGSVGDQ
ncbi:MAG: NAD-dependent epimerase/dehydratase family protein [Pseudomonadota bacterium]